MAELKTKPTVQSVEAFLNDIPDQQKREDSFEILKMMKEITKAEPKMWGASIIGFGDVHYKYDSGREGDWFVTGFSPRKQNLTLYCLAYNGQNDESLMHELGKFKTGKSCLYIKKLSDVNIDVLRKLIKRCAEKKQF